MTSIAYSTSASSHLLPITMTNELHIRYPSAQSLLLSIPAEISSKIIRLAIQSNREEAIQHLKVLFEHTEKRHSPHIKTKTLLWSPINVMNVCHQWFNICRSTPSLWSTPIIAFVGHHGIDNAREIQHIAESYVRHSSVYPLDVHIYALESDNASFHCCASFQRSCIALWSRRTRWRTATIKLHSIHDSVTLPLKLGNMELTRTLDITDMAHRMCLRIDFTTWSHCRDVTLHIYANEREHIPLSDLPHLETVHMSIRDNNSGIRPTYADDDDLLHSFKMLKGCHILQNLTVAVPDSAKGHFNPWVNRDDSCPPGFSLTLPRIRRATLIGYRRDGSRFARVLAGSTFVGLEEFHIEEPSSMRDLARFIRRSRARLIRLSVTIRTSDPLYIFPIEFIRSTRRVRFLAVYTYGYNRTFHLMEQLLDYDVFPNITSLCFGVRHCAKKIFSGNRTGIGFDYGGSLIELLDTRNSVGRVAASVDYPLDSVYYLDEAIRGLGIVYKVIVYTDNADKAYRLQSGKRPKLVHPSSIDTISPG